MKKNMWIAFLIATVAILVYLPALQNGFVNWDDEAYVVDNIHIRSLDLSFLRWAFFGFSASNWHPLTWISHAVDYALWGLNPFGHHLTSVILHGLNTFLVVFLTMKLLSKVRQSRVLLPAAITGLLFGIHPIHVESVAWVSERKDVLYAFFYLLGLLSYVRYVETVKAKDSKKEIPGTYFNYRYLVTLTLFTFSLMSKPMAITLPVVLLILDWYPLGRFRARRNLKIIVLEKIPFFILSLFSGIVTLMAQNSENSYAASLRELPISTRIPVAFKAIFMYIKSFLIPLNLIPLYRYPKNVSLWSPSYFIPIVLLIGVTTMCIFSIKKRKYLLAAWLFYIVSLLPVLGLIQVGRQSMADRYVYLALLGPAMLVGLIVGHVYERIHRQHNYKRLLQMALFVCFTAILGGLASATMKQIGIWKDGVTLWTYEVKAEPQFPEAYQRRANALRKQGSFVEAITDYTKAISLDPFSEPNYYDDRGICFANLRLFKEALQDFDTAIYMNPNEPIYRTNRENALRDMEHP